MKGDSRNGLVGCFAHVSSETQIKPEYFCTGFLILTLTLFTTKTLPSQITTVMQCDEPALCRPLAERIRKLPGGHGLLWAYRPCDREPSGGPECCAGGGTCLEGEADRNRYSIYTVYTYILYQTGTVQIYTLVHKHTGTIITWRLAHCH